MRARIIANPASGSFSKNLVNLIKERFSESSVFYTAKKGDAESFASKSEEELIFSCGGDGTFNEIVNGALKSDLKRALVYCPFGTGKDFGRSIGITGWEDLKKALDELYFADLDAAFVEGSKTSIYFINALDFGVGPNISSFLESHRRLGKAAIGIGLLLKVLGVKKFHVKITCDEKEIETKTIELIVGNGRYLGAGIKVAPNSFLNDGFLDLYVINPYGPASTLLKLKTIFDGSYVDKGYGKHFRCSRIIIEPDSTKFEADGEIFNDSSLRIKAVKSSIKVLINRDKAEALI